MSIKEISRYEIGDMLLIYEIEEDFNTAGFKIIPKDMKDDLIEDKFYRINSLSQLKIVGDKYPNCYGHGSSMRNSESSNFLDYKEQKVLKEESKTIINTYLEDHRGYEVIHQVTFYEGDESFEMCNIYKNNSKEKVTLEMISSFELGGITPFVEKGSPDTLLIHRLRSKWSHEGRLVTETAEDLQLEESWSTWSVSTERFGQVGSMPVKKYFPFVAIEDKKNQVFWGASLAIETSWQMEIYRQDDALHISGGLADREFGHWMKDIKPDETFTTPYAIISVCKGGGIDKITQRLTKANKKHLKNRPSSEESLPIIFNEYCTTWGNPSHDNVKATVEAIKDKGFEYFVIDCGWFKEEGVPWDISMGDYNVSPTLFPEGLEKTVELIKEANLRPGIWFEIDNIGSAAKAFDTTDHQLKRDGHPITTYSRRFWDMTDPWVNDYLTKKVIDMCNHYGFSYMKMDYNDTIGMGCDGYESLGEGLRQNMDASVEFVKKIVKEVPDIVLENCASGGHKLEPLMMSLTSMASFSDAHETLEIPIVAANLHRAILPEQSQIWAVIRKEDPLKRVAYSVANTFLGRMCLSGDVTELDPNQWKIIEDGMALYKECAPIIKDGYSHRVGPHITSERQPKGWQGLIRVGDNKEAMIVLHTFFRPFEDVITFKLPIDCPQLIKTVFSDDKVDIKIENGEVVYKPTQDMRAVVVHLV